MIKEDLVLIRNLTGANLDKAVSIAERIEVEDHKGHVAIKLPFSPEEPSDACHPQNHCMWRYYEPSKNWAIAGPIIARERISICASSEEDYWLGTCNERETTGDTALEAAMRSYLTKVFGVTIDLSAVPTLRQCRVRVHGVAAINQTFDWDQTDFFDDEVKVVARTSAEAERLARQRYPSDYVYVETNFLRWE